MEPFYLILLLFLIMSVSALRHRVPHTRVVVRGGLNRLLPQEMRPQKEKLACCFSGDDGEKAVHEREDALSSSIHGPLSRFHVYFLFHFAEWINIRL